MRILCFMVEINLKILHLIKVDDLRVHVSGDSYNSY